MHTLRRARVALVAGLVVVALAACVSPPQQQAIDLVNASRRDNGLPALTAHAQLVAKAQAWADKLAQDGRLSHSDLRIGITVPHNALGENVGFASSIEAVQQDFMQSPGHRANILDPRYQNVGTGVARVGDRVYVVKEFMQPAWAGVGHLLGRFLESTWTTRGSNASSSASS